MQIILFVLVAVVFIVAVIRLAAYSQKKVNEGLKQAASELGLQFDTGTDSEGRIASMGRVPAIPDFLKPLLASAMSANSWKMTGVVDGISMAVYPVVRGSGKNRTTYTVVEAGYRSTPPYTFKITKEGFFSKIGKTVFHMQDIQVGNPEFDERVVIKGSDPDSVIRLLSKPALQNAILNALNFHSGISITEAGVHFEQQRVLTDVNRYREILKHLSAVAQEIDRTLPSSRTGWSH